MKSAFQAIKNNSKSISGIFILTVFSAVCGYFIPSYLGSEKISTPNITIKKKELIVDLPEQKIAFLEKLRRKDSYILQRQMNLKSIKELLLDLKDLKKNFQELDAKEKEQSALRQQLVEQRRRDRDMNALNNIDSPKAELQYHQTEMAIEKLSEDIKRLERRLNYSLKDPGPSELRSKDISITINEIINLILEQYKKNKGNFQIDVVLYNSGDTQSVTQAKGILQVGETRINLKKKEPYKYLLKDVENQMMLDAFSGRSVEKAEFLNQFIVIDGKSYNGVTLVADPYNNEKRKLDIIKRDYLNGSEWAVLYLLNIKGEKIQSQQFRFIDSLQGVTTESLIDFLNSNFPDEFSSFNKLNL